MGEMRDKVFDRGDRVRIKDVGPNSQVYLIVVPVYVGDEDAHVTWIERGEQRHAVLPTESLESVAWLDINSAMA
jgi:hypothetical protein